MLPGLLDQIPPEEAIASVSADGACDTRGCQDAIALRGAVAVAVTVIPPRKNARLWRHPSPGAESRNEAVRVTALTFERQAVELPVRVALLNRFSQIGRPAHRARGRHGMSPPGVGVMACSGGFVQPRLLGVQPARVQAEMLRYRVPAGRSPNQRATAGPDCPNFSTIIARRLDCP